jgi:hypothetical protein
MENFADCPICATAEKLDYTDAQRSALHALVSAAIAAEEAMSAAAESGINLADKTLETEIDRLLDILSDEPTNPVVH